MFFEQYKHEPGIAVPRFWDTIATDDLTPPDDLEARRASGREALKAMERHLRDREYFVGEDFTIADIALYAYTYVAPEGGFDLRSLPAVRAWLERVAAQPGMVPIGA
jgi:glutathione S-transferase